MFRTVGDVCSLDRLITVHPAWTLEQLPVMRPPHTIRGDHFLNFSSHIYFFFVDYFFRFHREITKTLQLSTFTRKAKRSMARRI